MARIRSVHPAICESDDLVGLPAHVERTFVRLWTHCDDDGRCKDNPLLIKAAIYPIDVKMTPDAIEKDLRALADAGVIVRYEVDGRKYLSVPSFERWQHPQKKRNSDLPAPSQATTQPVEDPYVTPTVPLRYGCGPVVGVGVGVVEGVVVEEGGSSGSGLVAANGSVVASVPPSASNRYSAEFEKWWNAYPSRFRNGKGAAAVSFAKAKSKVGSALLFSALDAHATAWRVNGETFVPNPATWLNQARYDDEPPQPRNGSRGPLTRSEINQARIAADLARMTGAAQ